MRALVSALALVTVLAGSAASADAARRKRTEAPAPSLAASIAVELESGLDALGGFEDRCRAAGAWLLEGRTWLQDLAAWQLRSGVLAGWAAAAAAGADALLAVLDPDGRVPRLALTPYKMMTVRPADGRQSSEFGLRDHPVLRRRMMHKGIDFMGDWGTPVRASAPGLVVHAEPLSSYGNLVIVDHGMGVETRYAHLSRIRVRKGDFVAAGTRVGDIGATGRVTGAHLHFEVRYLGEAIDPAQSFVEPHAPATEPDEPGGLGELIAAWTPARLLGN